MKLKKDEQASKQILVLIPDQRDHYDFPGASHFPEPGRNSSGHRIVYRDRISIYGDHPPD